MKTESLYFCNAYPLTEQDFRNGFNKDFIQLYLQHKKELTRPCTWQEYNKDIVTPYIIFKNSFSNYGFNFIENFKMNDFKSLLGNTQQEVIILFTHCKNGGLQSEQIEFYDGLYSCDAILQTIPTQYDKILDLAVCNPLYLANKIRILRPGCVTRYTETSISISMWILFYAELLKNIIELRDYFKAYEKTIYKFWEK